jgi:thioester reductase-like protein
MNTASGNGAGYETGSVEYSEKLQGGYLQSKWVAESLIAQARDRGLAVTVHRPGTITGDSRTGSCNTDDFLCRMIKGCIQLGIAPEMNGLLDLTPVDYVSRAIVHLSKQKESSGKAFHLVNPHSINYTDFVNWIRARGYSLEIVPYEDWRAELSNLGERVKDNALFPLLPIFPPPRAVEQSSEARMPAEAQMPIERKPSGNRDPYSTSQNAVDGLEASSITCPLVDGRLLETYFSYLIRSDFLQSPTIRGESQGSSRRAPENASEQKAK